MSRTSSRARLRRFTAVLAVAAVTAVIAVGALVAARSAWVDEASDLHAALAEAPALKLGEITGSDGLPARGVFAQITSTGYFCLFDAPLAAPTMGRGGCNPADDPLGGRAVSASLSYDGGPSPESVSDARIVGIASTRAASVRVLMSDGSWRAVRVREVRIGSDVFQAFGHRFRKADLKKGIGPVAIVAFDADGMEIDRQTTGIG